MAVTAPPTPETDTVTDATAGQCQDCGGPLPLGRTHGRCMRCVAALGRAAKVTRRQQGATPDDVDDGPRAELRALLRCTDALGGLPPVARTRALRYLWALYGGTTTGAVEHNGRTP